MVLAGVLSSSPDGPGVEELRVRDGAGSPWLHSKAFCTHWQIQLALRCYGCVSWGLGKPAALSLSYSQGMLSELA